MLAAFLLRRYKDEIFLSPISKASSASSSDSYAKKFSNWWIDIDTRKGKHVFFFYPFFLVKRWFLVLITVIVGNNSGLQFIGFLNLNVASVVVYGWLNPHTTKKRRILEYFNDVMIMQLTYSMMCMTSFNLD